MGELPGNHGKELHPLKGRPVIALVAGEASGDQLGAALISRLQEKYPDATFAGVGGSKMKAAGMDTWWDAEELAVFGLFEVLAHFPRLLKLRRQLTHRLLNLAPDVFIGIDAPDFNLGLEIKLRRRGIRTVQYVSPTVWAWREKRVRKISRAADLVLCLFPFEPKFYKDHGVAATYVGHPMADQITADSDPARARAKLGLEPSKPTVALLPGSRIGEVTRLAEPMIEAARKLLSGKPDLQFVTAVASSKVSAVLKAEMERLSFPGIKLVEHNPRTVIASADAVMSASGTATLETLLINRPMVVAYRISPATYNLVKVTGLVKPQLFALPNILAGEELVPELIQHEANSENLAREINKWLDDETSRKALGQRFLDLHNQLQCDASEQAANAVSGLLEQ